MVIKSISIDNYKIFEGGNLISFPDSTQPVVFVGVNGAGKTTIIEAITGCLWEYYYRIQGKKVAKDERFLKSNINVNADEKAKVELWLQDNGHDRISLGFEINKTIEPEYNFFGSKQISDYIKELKGDVGFYKNESRVPIIVYYPVERTVLNPSLKSKNLENGDQFDAYVDAFEKSINFNHFFEWFRSTEDLENEIRLNKDESYSNKGLDAVRNAILTFLTEFTKIRVRRTSITSLVLEKNGEEYEVNQLSHGEKAIIALVGDLARRLVIANRGSISPLSGRGIVLIDELDLHLHPKWQKSILPNLRKTFPKIQFICTTHSPLVINHLGKDSIFLLENGECIPLKYKYKDFNSYGADIEDVLKVIQGADVLIPEDVKSQFDNLYNLLNKGEIEQAKKIIEKLKAITDPNQPELQRAEIKLKYKNLLKK